MYSLPLQQVTFIPLFFHFSVVVLLDTGKILPPPSVYPITLCLFEEARLRNRPKAWFRKHKRAQRDINPHIIIISKSN